MEILAVVAAVIGLVVAFCLAAWIKKTEEGTDRMKEIASYIREGAMAFLKREYKTMIIVIVVLFVLIGIGLNSWITAILYVCGALLSVLAGYFGMQVATLGNVRTANAAREGGMNKALKVAFRSGAVMGLCVSGLGLLGLGMEVNRIVAEKQELFVVADEDTDINSKAEMQSATGVAASQTSTAAGTTNGASASPANGKKKSSKKKSKRERMKDKAKN